ncbi:DNA repair protein RadA [Clostridia bacterium]|nr:DNA repair protein RadA [Clostridia bacterium]
MAKKRENTFFCKTCGYESTKWLGQCPVCKEWNSFSEEKIMKHYDHSSTFDGRQNSPALLHEIPEQDEDRISTGFTEMDRVLGGGIVRGSLILVGGDPGIGKSTLLLQICRNLSNSKVKVFYISGEESLRQIRLRADRVGEFTGELFFLCETSLQRIEEMLRLHKPDVVVIDSIQTMTNTERMALPGSIAQIKEATSLFMQLAKSLSISIFLIGHVTKEGVVAGPRVLEHMVDTVLYFEGERHALYRIIRGVKNRFGSTNEIGVFEMKTQGLVEVLNPSEYMLEGRTKQASGSVVACSLEGSRPLLLEIQALVCHTNFGMPRRTATGTDYNRLNLLVAVLEKRLGLSLSDCDAYVNIAGGLKVTEPALDLAIIMSIISSYKDFVIDSKTVFFGEVGLSGEIRSVPMAESRVREAAKLGFESCILPQSSKQRISADVELNVQLLGAEHIKDVLQYFV